MTMEAALRTKLLADGELTALVGTRITWVQRPQAGSLPAITLQTISADRAQNFGGFEDMQSATIQADVWAANYASAAAVTEALIQASAETGMHGGVTFRRAFIERRRDGFEQSDPQSFYRVSLDLTVWFST